MAPGFKQQIRFSTVTQNAFNDWENGGQKHWPCPAGGFKERRLEIFWDLQNCPLNGIGVTQAAGGPAAKKFNINAPQTYDLLFSVFGPSTGVVHKDLAIHVIVPRDTLNALGDEVANNIRKRHSDYLTVTECGAVGGKPGKPEHYSPRVFLEDKINNYLHTARADDVLVLISGDEGLVTTIRDAVQRKQVQVCQLHPNGDNGMRPTPPVWLEGEGADLVAWSAAWYDFLAFHATKPYNMRMSRSEKSNMQTMLVKDSVMMERKTLDNLGIVLLLDLTDSMQDVINEVKERLGSSLLRELQERYPALSSRMRVAVVAYRDIGCEREVTRKGQKIQVRQFEVHEFTNDVEHVSQFLGGLQAHGGKDFAEDIAGALQEVCKLPGWPRDGSSTIIFHVFDAPGHGSRFHDYRPTDPNNEHDWDRFFDAPPPGRRGPTEEIAESLTKLRNELDVIKYFAVTVNRKKWKPAPTDKTVAAFKEIVARLPDPPQRAAAWFAAQVAQGKDSAADAEGMRDNWIEEVSIGTDAATLVRDLIWATTRTLGVATSMSRVMSLRKDRPRELVQPLSTLVEDCEALFSAPGRPVKLPDGSSRSLPVGPLTPDKSEQKAQGQAVQESLEYREWYDNGGGREVLLTIKGQLLREGEAQSVEVQGFVEPYDLDQLLRDHVDSRLALARLKSAYGDVPHRILPQPFARGGERYAYLALDLNAKELYVMKEYSQLGKGAHSVQRLEMLLKSQVVAGFLAKEFNSAVAKGEPGSSMRLEYLPAVIAVYRKGDEKFKRNRFREPFVAGRMIKFNNNTSYVAPPEDFRPECDAFSHWTYAVSEGRLMVTDVQGWVDREARVVRLTDPCIHCQEPNLMDVPGKDRGLQGMLEFFQAHECHDTCRALGLDVRCNGKEQMAKLRKRIMETATGSLAEETEVPVGATVKDYKAFLDLVYQYAEAGNSKTQPRKDPASAPTPTPAPTPVVGVSWLWRQEPLVVSPPTPIRPPVVAPVKSDDSDEYSTDSDGVTPAYHQFCRFVNRKGGCREGDDCDYQHFRGECVHWRKFGRCRFGRRCWYACSHK